MSKLSRRQLLKTTGLSVTTVLGLGAISEVQVAAEASEIRFGIVSGIGPSDLVSVRLDQRSGGGTTKVRGSVLNRQLTEGDRVAIQTDSAGTLFASPVFTALSGAIDRRDTHQLTISGKSCVIDEHSTVRDAQNRESPFDDSTAAQGQTVNVLCVKNVKSGQLTVETVYPA